MKKYITAAALLVAGTAFVSAETFTLPDTSDFTWIPGDRASGIGTGASATIVQQLATAIENTSGGDTDLVGWFGGTGQGYAQTSYNDITITGENSFKFKCRPALSGEYVALVVELTEEAESITLSFQNDKKVGYSLWTYDAGTKLAMELIGVTGLTSATTVSQTFDTNKVEASYIFALWTANPSTGHAGGGTTITVSDIVLSYTTPIPEPSAFGLLAGLGALALVGSRRRRK